MNRISKVGLASLLVAKLLLAGRAWAEGSLSLAQLRDLALSRSSALHTALLSTDEAALAEKRLSQELLPSFEASAASGASLAQGGSLLPSVSASISASQLIWDGGRYGVEAAIDALTTKGARASARSALLAAEADVDSAYYAVLEAEAGIEAASQDLAAAKDRLALAQARTDAGIASRVDLLSAQSEAATAQTSLVQARRDSSIARARLASLTGIDPGASLSELDGAKVESLATRLAALDAAAIQALADRLVGLSQASNPDMAAARFASEAAARQVDLAKSDGLPSLSAQASQSLDWNPATGNLSSTPSVGLQASLAIAPWTVASSIKSAAIEAQKASLASEQSARTVELDLRESLFNLIADAEAVGSDKLALDYAEESYSAVLESYKRSAASVSSLSDAAASVGASRKALIEAHYGLLQELSSLSALVGDEGATFAGSLGEELGPGGKLLLQDLLP
ncbi:MAG TPA: TolC family protein [Rectinemataceae bacterium]|nr:TolC family protein [Rectinemataceae bacterium]